MMPLPICPLLDLLLLICTTLEWVLSFRQQEGNRRGWVFPLPMICTTVISESRRILATATAVLHSTAAVLPCPILIFLWHICFVWCLLLWALLLYYLLLLLFSILLAATTSCYYTLLLHPTATTILYLLLHSTI